MKAHVIWIVTAIAALPQQGAAMLQCIYYDQFMDSAPIVVQADGIEVGAPGANGYCMVSGQVVRSFRGPLAVGDRVDAVVPCAMPEGLVGGVMWSSVAALDAASVLELYLGENGGAVAGYGAGITYLDAPTDAPARKPVCG